MFNCKVGRVYTFKYSGGTRNGQTRTALVTRIDPSTITTIDLDVQAVRNYYINSISNLKINTDYVVVIGDSDGLVYLLDKVTQVYNDEYYTVYKRRSQEVSGTVVITLKKNSLTARVVGYQNNITRDITLSTDARDTLMEIIE